MHRILEKTKTVLRWMLYGTAGRECVKMPRWIKEDGAERTFRYGGHDFYFSATWVDLSVIDEVLFRKCYDGVRSDQEDMLHLRYLELISAGESPLILDCGAHIGSSAVYFSDKYPEAKIVAIEPVYDNYVFLAMNAKERSNIYPVQCAVSKDDGIVELYDPQGGSWSFTTDGGCDRSNLLGQVKSCSIANIVENYGKGANPFIIKIDIEGAEGGIDFTEISEVLQKFQLIIIELHDWMFPWQGKSLEFLKFAANGRWDFLHKGENIFLYNRNLRRNSREVK